jgi:hypothetical protein
MHKGRAYPYHPTFWATEAWFWPGFVPWKMTLSVFNNSDPPWGILTAGYGEVSQPGIPSPIPKTIEYHFTAHAPAYGLILKLNRFTLSGVDYARWFLQIVSGVGVWSTAVHLQDYPQRIIFNRSWPIVIGSIPYPVMGPPRYQFTPSLYTEGGSPWPPIGPP